MKTYPAWQGNPPAKASISAPGSKSDNLNFSTSSKQGIDFEPKWPSWTLAEITSRQKGSFSTCKEWWTEIVWQNVSWKDFLTCSTNMAMRRESQKTEDSTKHKGSTNLELAWAPKNAVNQCWPHWGLDPANPSSNPKTPLKRLTAWYFGACTRMASYPENCQHCLPLPSEILEPSMDKSRTGDPWQPLLRNCPVPRDASKLNMSKHVKRLTEISKVEMLRIWPDMCSASSGVTCFWYGQPTRSHCLR